MKSIERKSTVNQYDKIYERVNKLYCTDLCVCFPGGASGKEPACQETKEIWVRSLGHEYPLREGMSTHSSILAWRIPRTEEPGGLSP